MIRRIVRGVGTTFITIGVLILLFVVYELFGTNIIANRHQSALANEFEQILDQPVVEPTPSISPSPGPSPTATPSPKKVRAPRQGIARLRIPRIGLSVIVVEGTRLADLAYGPGHYRETPDIGERGSSGIAGHRTGWGKPFFNLDKLRPGDKIIFETPKATYTYRMTSSIVVDPSQSWVLGGDPKSKATHKLTLTTCTPKYTARDRLIVWADLVETVPRATQVPVVR